MSHVWTVRTINTIASKFCESFICTSRVRTVSKEGPMKRGKRGLDDKGNVTNVKEKETIEERQTRPVNLCHHLSRHFANGTSYKLARQRANDRNRRAKQCEGPKEGVSPFSINSSSCCYNLCYNTH